MVDVRRRWINGRAHALVVDLDRRGLHESVSLLRKRDGTTLLQFRPGSDAALPIPGRRHRPLDIAARRELGDLLGRLRTRRGNRKAPSRPDIGQDWIQGLGVPCEVLAAYRLPPCAEPAELVEAGGDRSGRPLWLTAEAAAGWQRMRAAALAEGIILEPVSGFRSAAYQHGLIARKRARGLDWLTILAASALPGFSEHHLGTTLDLHAGDGPILEEAFEDTAAFAWLSIQAARFSFQLSYPRDNPYGIAYEPWHWRFHGVGSP